MESAPTTPSTPSPVDSLAQRIALLRGLLLVTAGVSCLAIPTHLGRLQLDAMALPTGDLLCAAWLVAAAVLLTLLPATGLAAALVTRRRASWGLAAAGSALGGAWILVDLDVVGLSGQHLTDWLRFAGDKQPLAMAGGALAPAAAFGAAKALLAFGLIAGAYRLLARRAARPATTSPRALRRSRLFHLVAVTAIAIGPLGAGATVKHRRVLVWLAAGLHLPLEGLLPRARDAGVFQAINHALRSRVGAIRGRLEDPPAPPTPGPPVARHDVLVLVLESLRAEALDPEAMPRTSAWLAAHGRPARDHRSAANCTHNGMYGLLYGRSPVGYRAAARRRLPSPLLGALRAAGWRTEFIASSHFQWQDMEVFISPLNFDGQVHDDDGEDWERDRRTLARVAASLATPAPRPPRFICTFLMGTHFDYSYPKAEELFTPASDPASITWWEMYTASKPSPEFVTGWRNRYRNALRALDGPLATLLEGLDPTRTIVVITGDHGESLFDDRRWLHGAAFSSAQTQVPMWLALPGGPAQGLDGPTSHLDLAPTILAALGAPPSAAFHGRSLLAAGPPRAVHVSGYYTSDIGLFRAGAEHTLQLHVSESDVRPVGFLDHLGNPSLTEPLDSDGWAAAAGDLLDTITR